MRKYYSTEILCCGTVYLGVSFLRILSQLLTLLLNGFTLLYVVN